MLISSQKPITIIRAFDKSKINNNPAKAAILLVALVPNIVIKQKMIAIVVKYFFLGESEFHLSPRQYAKAIAAITEY